MATEARRHGETACSDPAPSESGTDLRGGSWARRVLEQASRELFLAQSSDWAFIMKMGTMVEYARRRVEEHLGQCDELLAGVEGGTLEESRLGELEARDNMFPEIDLSIWGPV